ncbi:hypothetical protein B6D60_04040 [candidate division KSB1 bacterium 4484_87]|nr:MAG: hypothetical protein B6D60_04040 [candidate division KSB1 bacterium 4484_87]
MKPIFFSRNFFIFSAQDVFFAGIKNKYKAEEILLGKNLKNFMLHSEPFGIFLHLIFQICI